MSGWGAGYVRAKGRTCPVILDLELSRALGQICSTKGVNMSCLFGQKRFGNLRNLIIKRFGL
jgi:hypothetical protein